MSPRRNRFVTASQQLLVLAVVLTALAPATKVVSLDVVAVHPVHLRHRHSPHLSPALSHLVGHPLRGDDRIAPLW